MSTAAKMIQGTPVLGKMFKMDGNDELASINAWPSIDEKGEEIKHFGY